MYGEIISPLRRTWPAILALFFLSPFLAEVLSGSTPPLALLSLFPWLTLPTFYGSGALLAREIVRRRRWGWGNLFVLGMAYGVLEEGIQVQTWFNFTSISPTASYHHYGEFFQINWLWAINLTMYHAVISITLPIVLAELFFPKIASRPWLGRRGRIGFSLLLAIVTIGVGLLAAFVFSAKAGYTHPPLVPYLLAIGIMLVLFVIGSTVPIHLPRRAATRPAPRLWTVRLSLFGMMVGNFFLVVVGSAIHVPALITIIVTIVYDTAALGRVYTWSQRLGWNATHRLAIVTGVIAFFFLFGPLVELTSHYPGILATIGTDCLALVGFIMFAGVIKRRERRTQAALLPIG
ncbi:MAG TPA: hypothetical protein VKB76_09645 [Ktedonobacterales bacterium]|nr:hypothetical protein [Ktedonobacterales bacterium]